MKKNLLLAIHAIALTLLVSCGQKNATQADYNVIPLPQEINVAKGEPFRLTSSTTIVYPAGNENLKRVANFLADYIRFATGKKLNVSDTGSENSIVLRSGLKHDNKEAYTLTVDNKQIIIDGATDAGTFYGIQTLRKSIPADADGSNVLFNPVTIVDYPRFGYRGMMLDVGRHIFPLEFIKEYIDLLALHNINTFHWHITDDQGWRIEIKKYPELTEKGGFRKKTVIGRNTGEYDNTRYGGFFTQQEAKEIVAYAKDRFITVIPEVDLPGHMLAALHAYPHLGCTGGPYEVSPEWGVFDDVLCAGNDEVFTFLENVFSEIIEIFPSEFIHIGGDECPKVRWESCPKCQARIKKLGIKADKHHKAEEKLQSYVISYMEKFLNSKGRKIIGWDEILEGGLAPNATVMSWRGTEGAIAAAQQGNNAIMVPTSHFYFDYYQTQNVNTVPLSIGGYIPLSKVYSFNPVPEVLTAEESKRILGVQANLWTEYIVNTDQVELKVLPRMDALAEVQWCKPERKDYDAFLTRLWRMIKHYDKKGYNYSKAIFETIVKVNGNSEKNTIDVSLSTIDNAPIYYTLDGTIPTEESKEYTGIISISEPVTITAKAFRPTVDTPVYQESFDMNKATIKPIRVTPEPHSAYAAYGPSTLVDGISGSEESYKNDSWLGFHKDDLEIIIDLKEKTGFSEVSFHTFVNTGDWIFGAKEVEVSVSDDDKNYKPVASKKFAEPTAHIKEVQENKVTFDPANARYVKLNIAKENELPQWHVGAGNKAFIFIDEVRVK